MKQPKKLITIILLVAAAFSLSPQVNISRTWVADQGDGTYRNPILHADYSDPDVCRAGEDYWMTASSFNCIPGLPILHSKDMVNWKLVNHAIDRLQPDEHFSTPQHGNGVWAPSIRYHDNMFYIYYGDPDFGIFMVKSEDPAGTWSKPTLVKEGKGLIDPCPLWDEDGKVYLVYAYAGSRAGIKSVLNIAEMNADGSKTITPGRIIYDGHALDPTIEGPKFYKRNNWYYIFSPAGGVATGWQTVLRSRSIYGPYERHVSLAQGSTNVNGPHQGAWVSTPTGENWFYHFQDAGPFGRIVHLQPMKWVNDWPVMGKDADGDGFGEPVASWRKPAIAGNHPIATPPESDLFDAPTLGLQWQWHANPDEWWSYCDSASGTLSLYSVPLPKEYHNLWDLPNLLLQKFPSNRFKATAKLTFLPSDAINGERTGLVVMGMDYGMLSLEKTDKGFTLSQVSCKNADKKGEEVVHASVPLTDGELFLRVEVAPDASCRFSYSEDGKKFVPLGNSFTAREGKWIGAKMGLFCSRPVRNNDGGRLLVDSFIVE
ncbi:MAG: glycoside hydrolase 43 family protein [Proteiniphilum sp.]